MSLGDSDSYRQFELYLEQVNDEIMRVFEDCNLAYNLEHDSELVTSAKNDFIESTNLLKNNQCGTDSKVVAHNCNNLICECKEPVLICNNTDIEFINGNHEKSTCSCNHFNLSEWFATKANVSRQVVADDGSYINSPSLPNMSISANNGVECELLDESLLHGGTDKHSKSMDDLPTSSWLYSEQNLNDDYSPVTSILKKVSGKVNKQTPSQLDRRVAEIEAIEACKWLRAAGFPQYAQLYEEMQFPVDVVAAQRDHPLLEPAVLQSLFRRLHALNSCATVCQQPCSRPDDSEDEQCALSNNWTYQSDLRRWSRTGEPESTSNGDKVEINTPPHANSSPQSKSRKNSLALMHLGKYEVNSKSLSTEEHIFLRRAATTRFRHHREGVVVSDVSSVSSVSDILLKRLGSMRYTEESIHSDTDLSNSVVGDIPEDEDQIFNDNISDVNTSSKDRVCWNSVQSIEPVADSNSQIQDGRTLFSLSCSQLQILRKLALLKLTAHIEKYCPSHRTGWNWELPKFIKKIRTPMYKDNQLLSIPLTAVLQRTGQTLPRGIQESLEWLRLNGSDQVGLFRKPGVRSRIQALKTMVESQGENINFNEQQSYDVADMVKQYFRELPEAVLTNKLSETFILIFQYVPPYLRKEAVRCTLLLMPDEHREVLQTIVYYLLKIAKCADVNQMNENNLAICFAPSLFQYSSHSSFCKQSSPHQRELIDVKAAQECLLYLMKNNGDIFNIPREFLNQCKLNGMNDSIAVQLSDLGSSLDGGWQGYMQECQTALLREIKEKNRGWIVVSSAYSKIELSYKKVEDGYPLRLWKVCADIEAPPSEVVHRILRERHIWDDDLHSAKIIAQMNKNSEVFHYVRRNVPPLPHVDYCVIRTWSTVLPRGTCVIVETSVEHPDIPNIPNTVRGIVLASRYLIEPGGSGRSRFLHLSRVDTRGRMPEWNHKNFGHLNVIHAAHIQSSFRQSTTGPESKV